MKPGCLHLTGAETQESQVCRHPRLRMESCVAVILDVNNSLPDGQIRPDIIRQFELIQDYLRVVTEDNVNESDIDRIEEATNQLLDEIASSCEICGMLRPPGWIN